MAKINMNDLAAALMEKHGIGRLEALRFLEAFVETIQEGVTRDRQVKIKSLGTFKVVDVDARESVNVNTGERLIIEGHPKLTFTPDTALNELINKPFSAFETVILNDGVNFDESLDVEEPVVEEPVVEEPVVEEEAVEEIAQEVVTQEPTTESESVVESPVEEASEPVEETPVESVEEVPEEPVEEVPAVPVEETPEEPVEETPAAPVEETPTAPVEEPKAQMAAFSDMGSTTTLEDDDIDDDDEPTGRSRWWLWLLLAAVACALTFFAGYWIGQRQKQPPTTPPAAEERPVEVAVDSLSTSDTITVAAPADTTVAAQPAAAETAAQPVTTQSTAEEDYLKYEAMDERVRRGAYNIIGTEEVIQAREGDTSRKIARRTIGEGMECYIEVYNGIDGSTVLKEGQEIKMPKLRVKKAARSKFRRK